MKIWIVSTSDPVPYLDREQRLCRYGRLAVMMAEAGHDVCFWASHFEHATKKHRCAGPMSCQPASKLHVELLEAPGYPSNVSLRRIRHNRVVSRNFMLRAEEVGEKPDLIFTQIPCLEMAEVVTEFGKKYGVPVVVDIEDIWPDLYLTMLPRSLVLLGRALLFSEFNRARRLLGRATAITAVSRTYLDWALRYAGRCARPRDGVFPLGFPEVVRPPLAQLAHDAEKMRRQLELAEDRFVVLFLGQFGASYDLETVIAAAHLVDRQDSKIQFVLAGAGDKDVVLRKRASGLRNVTFTGWLDQSSALQVLHLAHVGLAAYTKRATQSLPFKPFEYMSAALPTISSLEGELAELLTNENIGVAYEAGNPESLVNAVSALAQDNASRQKMGLRAREIFLERYDANVIYKQLIRLLEDIGS